MTKKELLKCLQLLKPDESFSHDEKGLGRLFANVFKDRCRYNVAAKEWFIYTGKVWREDTGAMRVSRSAKFLSDALLEYALTIKDDRKKNDYIGFINRLGRHKCRQVMVDDSRECYHIGKNSLDKNPDLFNCQNGTFNLKTFKLQPHTADDLLSKISNVIYDPTATSPLLLKFMFEIMQGDLDKVEYLQKLLGYALTADVHLETGFILFGATTRNGKSTFVETYGYMLGGTAGYAMTMAPESLAIKQNNDSRQASGDIARLDGCRFLNVSEPPKRMAFDVALFKRLLGRDSITCRQLYGHTYEFEPVFKLFMNTNFLPHITDDTIFSSGRINVILFERHFKPEEQDHELKNKLKQPENISAFFNWCLEGLKKFRKKGAIPPASVVAATDEYRVNSDKFGKFISECLESSSENCTAATVYKAYQEWCASNGYSEEGKETFYNKLRDRAMISATGTVKGKTERLVVKRYRITWVSKALPKSSDENDS